MIRRTTIALIAAAITALAADTAAAESRVQTGLFNIAIGVADLELRVVR